MCEKLECGVPDWCSQASAFDRQHHKNQQKTVGIEIECLEFLRLPWTEHCNALDNSSFSFWVQDAGFHLPKSELHGDEKLMQHHTLFLGPQL